jgi:hypothetical protein
MRYTAYLLIFFLAACGSKKDAEVSLNLIPVKSGQYWGYMNQEGKFIINPQFKYAFTFSEGLALVRGSDDKYGFINEEGKFIINPTYKSALAFSDGVAAVVRENAQIEFIDKNGEVKLTLPPEVETAFSFFEGRATIKSNGYYGFIDKTGKIVVPCIYSYAYHYKNGLARVAIHDSTSGINKYGFINEKGDVKVTPQFNNVEDFSDGLALISNGRQNGFIDKEGKFIINPQFDFATSFEENYAVIKQGELYGYINKEGKIVINPQYKYADKFYDGIATVKGTDGKYGFINNEGKYIINPQFEYSSRFYDGIAFLTMAGKQGLIDKTGKIIVNPQFDAINIQKDSDTWIISDFFDTQGVVSYIIDNITDNSVNGYSAATTFNNLKNKYPQLNEDNYSDFSAYTSNENRFVQLTKISTSYNGGLTTSTDNYSNQQVYDPVAGGYTTQRVYVGSTAVANPNATLDGITLYYNLKDKARNKKIEILKGLDNLLGSRGLVFNGSSDNYTYRSYVGKNYTISCYADSDYDITLQISFNVIPKNQVTSMAIDTTAN